MSVFAMRVLFFALLGFSQGKPHSQLKEHPEHYYVQHQNYTPHHFGWGELGWINAECTPPSKPYSVRGCQEACSKCSRCRGIMTIPSSLEICYISLHDAYDNAQGIEFYNYYQKVDHGNWYKYAPQPKEPCSCGAGWTQMRYLAHMARKYALQEDFDSIIKIVDSPQVLCPIAGGLRILEDNLDCMVGRMSYGLRQGFLF